MNLKIYDQYMKYGVNEYYKINWNTYYNPHAINITDIVNKYALPYLNCDDKILDIACGDGLISKILNNFVVDGVDPYFDNKYVKYKYKFEDIAKGCLYGNIWDVCICSYAYHLIEHSLAYDFLCQLALLTKRFIIISPSKKININHPSWHVIVKTRIYKITFIVLHLHIDL